MRNNLILGQWNALCDRCGFKKKSSMLRKEWTGLMVCESCFETKHPQLLIRVPKEDSAIPWTRPEPTDTFIAVSYPLTTEVADYDFIYTESGVILNT